MQYDHNFNRRAEFITDVPQVSLKRVIIQNQLAGPWAQKAKVDYKSDYFFFQILYWYYSQCIRCYFLFVYKRPCIYAPYLTLVLNL